MGGVGVGVGLSKQEVPFHRPLLEITVDSVKIKNSIPERLIQLLVGVLFIAWYAARDSMLVERRTCDRKVTSLNPRGTAGKFSSPELTFCAYSYSVSIPPCVTVVARKRPWSFYQECRWQVA